MKFLTSLIVLTALPLTTAAGTDPRRFEGSLTRLADTGRKGVVTLGYGAEAYELLSERHARGQVFALGNLPVPGGLSIDLELRPVSALEAGARAQVVRKDGRIELVTPSARCFSGFVAGGGTAFLGVTPSEIHGYFSWEGENYFVSTADQGGRRQAAIAHWSQTGGDEMLGCDAERNTRDVDAPSGEILAATTGPVLRTADIFVEADSQYRERFASDLDCINYTTILFTAASEIYRRDLGVHLNIPDRYLRVWNTVPPWGLVTGFSNLKNLYTWWQSAANPQRSISRAAVHLLTSPIFGGTARGSGGLCDTVRAYEIASVGGRFPYPTQHTGRDNWDLFVVCHELGHTFGSVHSASYTPPILCADGSGPDSGTIMSYCHQQYGIAQVGMRFHPREQQRIRSQLGTPRCLRTQLLTPGDYDGDGLLTPEDLSALRMVMAQGFRSAGADEVLDLDGDGRVDDLDHDALATRVYNAPPATVFSRNGKGVNPSCLEAVGNPVLGTVWQVRVRAGNAGEPTLVVGFDQPLAGLTTNRGELLVRTAPLGGVKIFDSPSVSNGTYATHNIALPLDPSLFGRAITFQGLVVGSPDGDHYCNALDAVLSPWE